MKTLAQQLIEAQGLARGYTLYATIKRNGCPVCELRACGVQ